MGTTYIERPQEYEAMQFEAARWPEIGLWLKERWSLSAYLITPMNYHVEENPRGASLLIHNIDIETPFTRGQRDATIQNGDWLVYNVGTHKWSVLYDSEFQQNYKELA